MTEIQTQKKTYVITKKKLPFVAERAGGTTVGERGSSPGEKREKDVGEQGKTTLRARTPITCTQDAPSNPSTKSACIFFQEN